MTAWPDLTGRRVLVTGGLGFIGSNLAVRCVELGADVVVVDNLEAGCGGNWANLSPVKERIRVLTTDIRSAEAAAALLDRDIVFHCAAFTSHAGSMRDPIRAVDVNCKGTITLLEAIRHSAVPPRVVHVGTSSQIGRMRATVVTEDDPEFPMDMYSATKTASEKYVLLYGHAHGIPVSVVRLSNVYGPRARIDTPDLGFVNFFVGLALAGRDVTVYGDGTQLRTLTFVDDVVAALLLAATTDASRGAVLFAAAQQQYSVREVAETIVRVIGRGRLISVPWPRDRAAIELGDAVISSARIGRLLGWSAKTSLADGMAITRDFFIPRLQEYVR